MTEERVVSVAPERLGRWLDGFAERHGPPSYRWSLDQVRLVSPDGAEANLLVPFPPLPAPVPGQDGVAGLLRHAEQPRTVGALLIRRGGVAVGVFRGRDLMESKVETAYVQGRTKAGGWSQQRYARRRDNQARGLVETAAELAVRMLLPRVAELASLVGGGDANLLDAVLADARLVPLRSLLSPRVLPVPDPRQRVLAALPDQFLAVTVRLNALA